MNSPDTPPSSPSNAPFDPQTAQLPRVLGPWLAMAIVVGCVIGTGVFKKAHAISKDVPESGVAITVWVVVGLLTLCGAMALAEIAALFPRAGGNYVFLREAYGRLFGFLWGWVEFWFLRVASCAALAAVFAESFHNVLQLAMGTNDEVLGFWPRQAVSAGVVAILGLLAARGTKLGASVSFAVTCVKVGSILALMVLPIVIVLFVSNPPTMPSWSNFKPVWPESFAAFNLQAFAVAMVAVMWPYNGWSNVASIAGEVKNPQRNVPIAFVGGLLLLIALYSLVNLSYFSVVPSSDMKTLTDIPVASEFARRLLGPIGLLLASMAIMFSTFGALSGNMLVGPRGIFAMSRDGLAPSSLARIHARFETPFNATILMTVVTASFIFAVAGYAEWQKHKVVLAMEPFKALGGGVVYFPPAVKPQFDVITDFITFGGSAFEALAVASIYLFRRRYREEIASLPYRCPGYPVIPAIFVVCMSAVLVNMLIVESQRNEALIGCGFIAVGAILYLVAFARKSSVLQ
jgi:APA family basic amino acid/polyamine antiporter